MFLERLVYRKTYFDSELGEAHGQASLARVLNIRQLVLLGVSGIVGAGIFSSIGQIAAGTTGHTGAGPSLIVSYVLTAIACGLSALCYAEIASMVPIAGSAYSYAYATLGEIWAWTIGWDLVIEYAIGNVYVAQSWADYFRGFLRGAFGIDLPNWLVTDLQTALANPHVYAGAPHVGPWPVSFNLPAVGITTVLTLVLLRGIRESVRLNTVLVLFKLALLVVFVAVGAAYVKPSNWQPFAPGGWHGIWAGASLAFFSYIGFDALSTTAEEARDPERTVPRAMLISLGISAGIYLAVAAVMTGLVPSAEMGSGDPLSRALNLAGLHGMGTWMALGGVVAVTAVLLVFQIGQPRILLAMSRDGLLPRAFAVVSPRFRTPVFGTVATGVFVALGASLMTESQALELTSIGTLFAFIIVAAGVIALRIRDPYRHRPFRCPLYPWTPLLAIGSCIVLMLGLPAANWYRFAIWLVLGLIVYALYGYRHARH